MYRYDSQGGNVNASSISYNARANNPDQGGGAGRVDERKTFGQIKDEALGREKADWFVTKGTISLIKHEKEIWYFACPTPGCNKKVTDMGNGSYSCAKCNQSFPTYDVR